MFSCLFQGVIRLIDKAMKGTDISIRGGMANEIHKHMDLAVSTTTRFDTLPQLQSILK